MATGAVLTPVATPSTYEVRDLALLGNQLFEAVGSGLRVVDLGGSGVRMLAAPSSSPNTVYPPKLGLLSHAELPGSSGVLALPSGDILVSDNSWSYGPAGYEDTANPTHAGEHVLVRIRGY